VGECLGGGIVTGYGGGAGRRDPGLPRPAGRRAGLPGDRLPKLDGDQELPLVDLDPAGRGRTCLIVGRDLNRLILTCLDARESDGGGPPEADAAADGVGMVDQVGAAAADDPLQVADPPEQS
jgi:hypothetical protein